MPKISAIVPVHNVEPYLFDCLTSLAVQSFDDFEVVMVDDGSTDASADIAEAFARDDHRFTLVRQANAGLGAARNAGVAQMAADSEFLMFVDSDDLLTERAFELLLGSLEESGSDFATGNVHHVNAVRTWQVPMLRILAGHDRPRTHITRLPRLVSDRIACNKLFRRSFWEAHSFSFPVGVLHEDIPVVLPAHHLAEAVDIVAEPVYLWRMRPATAEKSITQRRSEPASIQGRGAAVTAVSRFLGDRFPAEKHAYDLSVLRDDLRTHLKLLAGAEDDYRRAFMDVANTFLDQTGPELLRALSLRQRVQWALVRRRDLEGVLASLRAEAEQVPVTISGRWVRRVGYPELPPGTEIPRHLTKLGRELLFKNAVSEVCWDRGRLRITGDSWISMLDAVSPRSQRKIAYVHARGSRIPLPVPVRQTPSPERTATSGGVSHRYDWAGFEAVLDPRMLRTKGRWTEGVWCLGMCVVAPGAARRGPLQTDNRWHPAAHPPYRWVDKDVRVLPFVHGRRLELRVEKVRALVTAHEVDGDRVRLTVALRGDAPDAPADGAATVRLSCESLETDLVLPAHRDGDRVLHVDLPVSAVAGHLVDEESPAGRHARGAGLCWATALHVRDDDGRDHRYPLVVADGIADLEVPCAGGEAALTSGHNGYLKVWARRPHAVVTSLAWDADGGLELTGRIAAPAGAHTLVVRSTTRTEEKTSVLDVDGAGRFATRLTPAAMPSVSGTLPLKSGLWKFWVRLSDEAAEVTAAGEEAGAVAPPADMPVKIDRLAADAMPGRVATGGRAYTAEAHWHDTLHLNCHSGIPGGERGLYHQLRLRQDVYGPLRRTAPLRETALFVSYNGKQFSDSPRAVHEELRAREPGLEHLWVVRDGQVALPPHVRAVALWSRQWYEALATAKYVVTNAHLPDWFERRPGQVVVQTWHGTMLKKIGHDIETTYFDAEYKNRISREARNWSVLVSANRFSTPILRRAFKYEGTILESGYPRNDCFYADDLPHRIAAIREELDLPEDKKVILYAPTWRDDLTHGGGNFKMQLALDLEQARARLGDDHVLLIRRHSNVVDSIPGAGQGFVRDVSEYPDIADLYMVSDILITDYSSVMFDFAHTGRPMLFFTHDLEHYRDTLRGFYFDFEENAPGPLLFTTEEVLDAVEDIDAVAKAHKERYTRFTDTFCDLDDGQAARRVVDRMLEWRD
ncbi:CDP-glycerol glycerophosphotransferase family protein [Streptomyces sp. NPDC060194]|uniref:bifunctional glycosyltransferase/CDP-glycerol:glycerophosphate glycerophosphotransferase n=1 Tax=Streptomyces sp. NPDC060194 TaxID=3347069 RepID=UPI00365B32DC